VPLRAKNDIVGVLLLGVPEGRERFSAADKETLSGAADVFALMIENARLSERALEQEKLRRDLALAAEVQKRLLPPGPPRTEAAILSAVTLPARTVGGDYYDFIDLGRDAVGIAVADVSGKGIAAALVMSVVQASLRVISAQSIASLSELAEKMNGFIYQSTGANKYATFFYAEIDRGGRRLRYVNAGHNPPYLLRRTNESIEVCELTAGGTVLGLFPDVRHDESEIDLRPGDLLVAFTDGVPEALNADGEEFGEERLKSLLREGLGQTADDIAANIASRMREWIGSAEQHDDLTFIVAVVAG
jgi:sigma-B regulation protein RsbU (phosphoserine phosphatase)